MNLFIDHEIYDGVVLDGILQATRSLRLATATLKNFRISRGRGHSRSFASVLASLQRKGVDVRLLHAGIPSSDFRRELKDMDPGAFGMKRCVRVHLKAVVVDSRRLYTGSANLTGAGVGLKSSRRRNFEIMVVTETAEAVDRVSDLFDAVWNGTMCTDCDRQEVCYVPLEEPW